MPTRPGTITVARHGEHAHVHAGAGQPGRFALRESVPLRRACNVLNGAITHPGVAEAMNERATDPLAAL